MSGNPDSLENAYHFGDTALAARRLDLLAQVFAPSTREFLSTLAERQPRRVLDLGCGTGHTTRLLAEAFPAAEVLGLDNSLSFVSLASKGQSERVRFQIADVTRELPGSAYDLIYCRYLLTHLPAPETVVAQWGEHLRPGGILAIEENDWIRTTQPAFATYLDIVAAMLASSGQHLHVGQRLATARWSELQVARNELVEIPAASRDAARMFVMNLQTWRERPFVSAHYDPVRIGQLEQELKAIVQEETDLGSICFGRRRLVLERS